MKPLTREHWAFFHRLIEPQEIDLLAALVDFGLLYEDVRGDAAMWESGEEADNCLMALMTKFELFLREEGLRESPLPSGDTLEETLFREAWEVLKTSRNVAQEVLELPAAEWVAAEAGLKKRDSKVVFFPVETQGIPKSRSRRFWLTLAAPLAAAAVLLLYIALPTTRQEAEFRGGPGSPPIVLLQPVALAGGSIQFSWKTEVPDPYVFKIYHDFKVIYEKVVQGKSLILPSAEVPLQAGTPCRWTVAPQLGGGCVAQGSFLWPRGTGGE